jgi:hypothetical protein
MNITVFKYFWFLLGNKTSLALYPKRKQKYQNGNIHKKLTVPTSEGEGKLSNPRGRAARARCMNFPPKVYEIPRTDAARAPCVDFAAAKSTVREICSIFTCRMMSTLLYHCKKESIYQWILTLSRFYF